jgi:hypothetical protein
LGSEAVTCDCAARGNPEWAFCEDDLFCPQCGRQISWLRSTNQRPIGDPAAKILVYPQKSDSNQPAYRIPIALHHSDRDREKKSRPPALELKHCRGPSNAWFTGELAEMADTARSPYLFELIRRKGSTGSLPSRGISGNLDLAGDFAVGPRRFEVRVCNLPQVEIELVGNGVEHASGEDYNVYLSEELTVALTIVSKQAPILVDETMTDVVVSDVSSDSSEPSISAKLHTPLEAGTEISENTPWTSQITLDTRRFTELGAACELLLPLKVAVADLSEPVLQLRRIEKGRLEFSPANLIIPPLYRGEVCSNSLGGNPEAARIIPKWRVTNVGEETIRIHKPEVEDKVLGRRITVEWAVDADPDSQKPGPDAMVQLEPGTHAQLFVQIDVAERDEPFPVSEQHVSVSLTDERNKNNRFHSGIRFNDILPRKDCTNPLAIDFGNTHSYAATWKSTDSEINAIPSQAGILTVHDLSRPDVFPTALFFEDITDRNNPIYMIGREALALGQQHPEALVTDLKRWIGDTGANRQRMVSDRKGNFVKFEIERLVQLFLLRLIEKAEAVLREYRIRSIGLSYPAKFGPQKRASLERIVRGLCVQRDLESPRFELAPGGLDVDEANAVAIGCIFDSKIRERELKHVVSPEHPSFVIAAIDLGGGSLDTALLEFEFQGGQLSNEIQSRYLGIGGDDAFGGDIVTLALMELLSAKLRQLLQAAGVSTSEWRRSVPLPSEHGNATGLQRRNFDALWSAAEEMKLFLCTIERSLKDDSPDAPPDESESHKRLVNVLQSQLVGRLDLTHQAGRQAQSVRGNMTELLEQAINDNSLLVDLNTIYSHPIASDFNGRGGYTVKERLTKCLDELEEFCAPCRRGNGPHRPKVEVDVVLLCGAGCGLPLVEQSVRERDGLKNCRVIHDHENAKRLVSFGLVRYLDVHGQHPFAKSSDYTNDALGLLEPGFHSFIEIVPACSEVLTPAHQSFPLTDEAGRPIPLKRYANNGRLRLYRLALSVPVSVGFFNFREPPTAPPHGELPADLAISDVLHRTEGSLRLVGSEIDIELDLSIDGARVGTWRLTPQIGP